MSVVNWIGLVALLVIACLVALFLAVDCVSNITNPPPPTSTPNPRIGVWLSHSADKMTNGTGLAIVCWY